MKFIKSFLVASLLLAFTATNIVAQHEEQKYVPETDTLVLQKLEQWQDLKFGLLMHWGPYSQWGVVESWSICPEDYGWCERKKGSNPDNYFRYKQEYENLKTTFNPVDFDPERWAKAASKAGMKYVVFTTKHHDGFCMFDSKYTDYKITDSGCPYSVDEKANVTLQIFEAFRNQGLWAGAYFSKPDWNHENYWDPKFPPFDRNVNYDPALYPDKWEKYVQFTHNQIMELMTDYGKVDILWLDGGWVCNQSDTALAEYYEKKHAGTTTGFIKNRVVSQDIRMDEIAAKARVQQPGLIVVDRAVPGINQNYLTPENRVPEKSLPYPWESCIIAGGGWSWVENANYKSTNQVVHMLVDIVAKGGNLLLNIAPGPQGQWHDQAYVMLDEMGSWIDINGEAIYGTRAIAPFKEDNICLTQKGEKVYAIYLAKENEKIMPESITLKTFVPEKIKSVKLLGSNVKLKWQIKDGALTIKIPKKLRDNPVCMHAWSFEIQ